MSNTVQTIRSLRNRVHYQQDNAAFHLRFITIKENLYLISMGKLLKAIYIYLCSFTLRQHAIFYLCLLSARQYILPFTFHYH